MQNVAVFFLGFLVAALSLFMILLVLIQRGRGGGITGALGGAGGQSAFGSKAGDIFTRVTVVTATIWIFLCMMLIITFNRAPRKLQTDKDGTQLTTENDGLDSGALGAGTGLNDEANAGDGSGDETGDDLPGGAGDTAPGANDLLIEGNDPAKGTEATGDGTDAKSEGGTETAKAPGDGTPGEANSKATGEGSSAAPPLESGAGGNPDTTTEKSQDGQVPCP